MDNESMLHADSLPATKGDLKAFATKIDLERFATKEEMASTIKRELSVIAVRVDAKLDAWAEKIGADNERFRSTMITHVDKCLSVMMGVKNGEIILGHRVDELEKRVTILESDPKHPT